METNENLNNLIDAIEKYINLETSANKLEYWGKDHHLDIRVLQNPDLLSKIPIERACKLRNNILNHIVLCQYHKVYQIRKPVIIEIFRQFEKEKKLVWDLIELNGSLNFALGIESSTERWLALDRDHLKKIDPVDLKNYLAGFEKNIAPILDKNFTGNGFSNKNTRTVYVMLEDDFNKLKDEALKSAYNELYLETCIISYDLDDIISGASVYSLLNRGQLSFFEKVTDDSLLTIDINHDVNPTRPPY